MWSVIVVEVVKSIFSARDISGVQSAGWLDIDSHES
jgi:hypothetical protein